jgi:hypothetical protein
LAAFSPVFEEKLPVPFSADDPMTQKRAISRKGAKSAKGGAITSPRSSNGESSGMAGREELIPSIQNVVGVILAVTENRNWIEVFFEGDLMHTKTVNLPSGMLFDIYIEEIPHKTTVYEHPRTMIFFERPCDLHMTRDGDKLIITGVSPSQNLV